MRFFRLHPGITHGIYDKDTTIFLKLREHNTERAQGGGHSLQLYQQNGQKATRKRFFSLRVEQLWNSLPDTLWNQIT